MSVKQSLYVRNVLESMLPSLTILHFSAFNRLSSPEFLLALANSLRQLIVRTTHKLHAKI